MEVDNELNVLSEEGSIIVTLMGMVHANSKQSQSKKSTTNYNKSESKSKKPYVIPEWKQIPPASDVKATKIINGRIYH